MALLASCFLCFKWASFSFIFVFTRSKLYKLKKRRWCTWDSNPVPHMVGADETAELWRFLYFPLFNSKYVDNDNLPMTWFEPRTSGIGSNCFASWASTTAQVNLFVQVRVDLSKLQLECTSKREREKGLKRVSCSNDLITSNWNLFQVNSIKCPRGKKSTNFTISIEVNLKEASCFATL